MGLDQSCASPSPSPLPSAYSLKGVVEGSPRAEDDSRLLCIGYSWLRVALTFFATSFIAPRRFQCSVNAS